MAVPFFRLAFPGTLWSAMVGGWMRLPRGWLVVMLAGLAWLVVLLMVRGLIGLLQ